MTDAEPTQLAQTNRLRSSLRTKVALACLLAAALMVRLVGIDRPLVGNFSTKSAVYAMVARNWAVGRAPLWRPTIDLSSHGERAWHLMEWPASAYLAGFGWRTFGGSLDAWGRGVSIACSLAAVVLMFFFARRSFGDKGALVAAAVVAFSPVSIVYGQCFMLEASVLALTLGTLYAFDVWLRNGRPAYLRAAVLCFTLLVLTKIYMLVLLAPLAAMAWRSDRRSPRLLAYTCLAFTVAVVPGAVWYNAVLHVPAAEGPAAEHHPLGRATIHAFPHPLLSDGGYWTQVVGDLATHVLTPLGLAIALAGLATVAYRRFLALAASLLLLLVALPLKFAVANYYYVVLLPAFALAVGAGWQTIERRWNVRRTAQVAVAAFSLIVALRYAVGPAYRTPAGDVAVLPAAAAARECVGEAEPIATLHGSGVDLLYYCDRRGWALNADDADFAAKLEAARREGAEYLVVADLQTAERRADVRTLLNSLPVVRSGDDWRILALSASATAYSVTTNSAPASSAANLAEFADSRAAGSRRPPAPSNAMP